MQQKWILLFLKKVPIRLSDERWFHITENHSEVAGYYYEVLECVEEPETIYEGRAGECIAIELENGKYIVVIYKEVRENDGFIITAFLTSKKKQLERRRRIWPK